MKHSNTQFVYSGPSSDMEEIRATQVKSKDLRTRIGQGFANALDTAAWVVGSVVVFVLYPLAMGVLEDRFVSKYAKQAPK